MRYAIRFGRFKLFLVLFGCTPDNSYLELDGDQLQVQMGWGFKSRFPLVSVRSAERAPDSPLSIGIHGWGGRWIVNGAASPMVAISIEPPAHARVLGFPVTLRELRVSVDDPDALIAALTA